MRTDLTPERQSLIMQTDSPPRRECHPSGCSGLFSKHPGYDLRAAARRSDLTAERPSIFPEIFLP